MVRFNKVRYLPLLFKSTMKTFNDFKNKQKVYEGMFVNM